MCIRDTSLLIQAPEKRSKHPSPTDIRSVSMFHCYRSIAGEVRQRRAKAFFAVSVSAIEMKIKDMGWSFVAPLTGGGVLLGPGCHLTKAVEVGRMGKPTGEYVVPSLQLPSKWFRGNSRSRSVLNRPSPSLSSVFLGRNSKCNSFAFLSDPQALLQQQPTAICIHVHVVVRKDKISS